MRRAAVLAALAERLARQVYPGRNSCDLSGMRTQSTLVLLLLVLGTACNQKTETRTTADTSGTVQTKTTTVTATVPAIDTTATAEVKREAKEAVKDAAHATGTALEKAGKEIQKRSKGH